VWATRPGASKPHAGPFCSNAYRDGARIVVKLAVPTGSWSENGRAVGVEGDPTSDGRGRKTKTHTRSQPAGGGRRRIHRVARTAATVGASAGQAVGKVLSEFSRAAPFIGVYEEKQRSWWGSPMTANCEAVHRHPAYGFGFYMEISSVRSGVLRGRSSPWGSGRQHKEVMTKVPYISTFIWVST